MKETFRQSMAWLHSWAGLVVGWVLFFTFVTGTAGYFRQEITRWMQPEAPLMTEAATAPALDLAQRTLEREAADASGWWIDLPDSRSTPALSASWEAAPKPGERHGESASLILDPVLGRIVPQARARATGGGNILYQMHYRLHYVPRDVGVYIVGVCTMLMLVAILTGIVTHKKIFKDFFTFRPGKGQRSWLDMHNVISVTSLPFFLMITYSGLVLFLYTYMPAGKLVLPDQADAEHHAQAPAGSRRAAPLPRFASLLPAAELAWGAGNVAGVRVERPGRDTVRIIFGRKLVGGTILGTLDGVNLTFDANGAPVPQGPPRYAGSSAELTASMFAGLHYGGFARLPLRWLYFLSGLLGAGMIGTGLVLWTVKRRQKQPSAFGLRLVDALNIGTIAGLPTAIAAYFWANRLLPVAMANRADWEMHSLYICWGALFVHAGLRVSTASSNRGWIEQLLIGAAAWALLPALNLLTTSRHLGVTIPAGDWVLASFDGATMVIGAVLYAAATHVRRKAAEPAKAGRVRRKEALA